MSMNLLVNGEAMNASLEGLLAAEQFLDDHYLFRRNVLSGKVEFAEKTTGQTSAEDAKTVFRQLTELALNSIVLEAKREDVCEGKSPRTDTSLTTRRYLLRLPETGGGASEGSGGGYHSIPTFRNTSTHSYF